MRTCSLSRVQNINVSRKTHATEELCHVKKNLLLSEIQEKTDG